VNYILIQLLTLYSFLFTLKCHSPMTDIFQHYVHDDEHLVAPLSMELEKQDVSCCSNDGTRVTKLAVARKLQKIVVAFAMLMMFAGLSGCQNKGDLPAFFRSFVAPPAAQAPQQHGAYRIGQEYGGGIIFYVDATGKHGLIAAKDDVLMPYTDAWQGCVEAVQFRWSTGQSVINNNGDYAYQDLGTLNAIGQGALNTRKMLERYPVKTYPYSAAAVATGYKGADFTDWFLPSKDELNQLYLNKNVVGGFSATESYWSSSELGSDLAWYQYFNFGYQSDVGKEADGRVRPVRAF